MNISCFLNLADRSFYGMASRNSQNKVMPFCRQILRAYWFIGVCNSDLRLTLRKFCLSKVLFFHFPISRGKLCGTNGEGFTFHKNPLLLMLSGVIW